MSYLGSHARSYSEGSLYEKNMLGLSMEKALSLPLLPSPVSSPPRRRATSQRLFVGLSVCLFGFLLWASTLDTVETRVIYRPMRERGLKTLHLIDRHSHESVMNRWFQQSFNAFDAHSSIEESYYWGPGFPDYDSKLSLADNVERQCGSSSYFDLVIPYLANGSLLSREAWLDDLQAFSETGTVLVDRPYHLAEPGRREMIRRANISLVLSPHSSDLTGSGLDSQALLAHQTHAVDLEVFETAAVEDREIDVLVTGLLDVERYPLRARMAQLVEAGAISGSVRGYPGKALQSRGVDTTPPPANALHFQVVSYAQQLGNAKICIVDGTTERFATQVYSEAASAGCMLMGIVPADRREAFAGFMVPIDENMSDDELVSTVQTWLDNDEARLSKAAAGQAFFAEHTTAHMVDDVVRYFRMVQQGQRGVLLPYGLAH